jgi:hypothetical protein
MFILSYFRKKQTIKVKEDTLENLDDDFIVISDNLKNTSIEEENTGPHHRGETDKKEQTVKNIDNSIEENSPTLFSVPQDKGYEENDRLLHSSSRQGSLFETSSSLRSQRRDEENQLIENTKDEHCKKLSLCDEIMNKIQSVYQIFNEKLERALH